MKYIRLLQAVLLKIRMLLGTNKAYIDLMRKKGAIIGSDCEIYKSVNFGSEPYLITIGNHVRINSGVQLVTHDGGIWVLRSPKAGYGNQFINADKFGRIVIHDNVHIGTNAVIMPGVEIGENVIIGCGAIVTKSVQPNEVWAGVPANRIETLEEYVEKNVGEFVNTKHLNYAEKEEWIKENL